MCFSFTITVLWITGGGKRIKGGGGMHPTSTMVIAIVKNFFIGLPVILVAGLGIEPRESTL